MLHHVAALLDLIMPPACPGCGREGKLLCVACRAPFERRLDEPPGAPLGMPIVLPRGLLQLEWVATYSGPVRVALHALKYGGERRLARPLGAYLAARWRRVGHGGEVLVPVPVHADRLRQRGYDQALLLARAAGDGLGLPVAEALARRAATAAMHALDREARARNVGGAFVPTPVAAPVGGRHVLLVDDVVTTGATLAACAATLRAAGASGVSAITVARDR
ncbi:MAG TPA: phosphoribosyltransferase family protein [Candidatus Limnocylindrales bacterium]|nr:phosphoribosyltransferase family protein [Candidatus Limnocylindrales bacterium]